MSDDSMSNSDILRQEKASFSNITLKLMDNDGTGVDEPPFIVGALDDFGGNLPQKPRPKLEDRTFDKVTRYTLDKKMEQIGPGLGFEVKNTLKDAGLAEGETLGVKLAFKQMSDFDPTAVASQIEPLRKLMELRKKLRTLHGRALIDSEFKKTLESMLAELSK